MDLDIQVKLQQIQLTEETGTRIEKGYRQLLFLRATEATKRLRLPPPPQHPLQSQPTLKDHRCFFSTCSLREGTKNFIERNETQLQAIQKPARSEVTGTKSVTNKAGKKHNIYIWLSTYMFSQIVHKM